MEKLKAKKREEIQYYVGNVGNVGNLGIQVIYSVSNLGYSVMKFSTGVERQRIDVSNGGKYYLAACLSYLLRLYSVHLYTFTLYTLSTLTLQTWGV